MQFHLEITPQIVEDLLEYASGDKTPGAYVQSSGEIRKGFKHCSTNRAILFRLLDRFLGPAQKL
jgi:hypothetical protein